MSRVRIVGGGLTGILAAFQAHRLGVRDITLYERFDQLGGVALGGTQHGLEIREGCIYFGPRGDPIRDLLEQHGLRFTEFDNRFGSISPGGVATEDFGGPALPAPALALRPPAGPSLADRIACYPQAIAQPLAAYARWHLGPKVDLAQVHGSSAIPLAINRVFPTGIDLDALVQAKQQQPLADELFAIPRAHWGRTANLRASLPQDGFPAFMHRARRALQAIGVRIQENTLIAPRQSLAERADGDVLVWAANPTPLFKAVGVPTPRLLPKSFTTHVISARWTGPLPFYVQNFTAEGTCFRVYIYESAGRILLTAECVDEPDRLTELRNDIHRMTRPFGDLVLGEPIATAVKPRWIYHTVEAIQRLGDLRAAMARQMGPGFVAGAWEPYAKAEKFHEVNAALDAALSGRTPSRSIAAA